MWFEYFYESELPIDEDIMQEFRKIIDAKIAKDGHFESLPNHMVKIFDEYCTPIIEKENADS